MSAIDFRFHAAKKFSTTIHSDPVRAKHFCRFPSVRKAKVRKLGQAPVVELTPQARRLRAEMAILRKERDDLAESLAQIEAYQPGILSVAKAWAAHRPIYVTAQTWL